MYRILAKSRLLLKGVLRNASALSLDLKVNIKPELSLLLVMLIIFLECILGRSNSTNLEKDIVVVESLVSTNSLEYF